jgi:hypothetical protein
MAVGATGIRKRLSGNVERAEPPDDYVRWEDVVSVDSDRIVVRARS